MHMLEAHVVKFIRQHKFPLGFFGEQGGESIHHEFREFADLCTPECEATAKTSQGHA